MAITLSWALSISLTREASGFPGGAMAWAWRRTPTWPSTVLAVVPAALATWPALAAWAVVATAVFCRAAREPSALVREVGLAGVAAAAGGQGRSERDRRDGQGVRVRTSTSPAAGML